MGYYTDYNLEIKINNDKTYEEIKKQVVEFLESKNLIGCVFDESLDYYNSAKWYEHEQDIKEMSLKITNVLFKLSGEGEDRNDVWNKYFVNGKMQICKIEYSMPPFDENKLE